MRSTAWLAMVLTVGLFLILTTSLIYLTGEVQAWGPALQEGAGIQADLPAPVPQAQVGTGFTYQGRLTEGNSPANGSYDFRFTLYDAEVGGS